MTAGEFRPAKLPPRATRGPLFWLQAARAPFFTGSLAPVLVGTSLALYDSGTLDCLHAGLTLVALMLLHAGANLANDYYDHVSGGDEINVSRAAPFTGGSRFIQDGLALPGEILTASAICLAAGGAIGLYLVWVAGLPIILLGVFGAITGFFYSAPPLKLGYRGLGEMVVFLDFGLLPVAGAYYIQTGSFSAGAALLGAVVGLLMANVLWINQFQDAEADAAVGKRHWVVRLGRRRSAFAHGVLFLLSYGLLLFGLIAGHLPGWTALAFLSVPAASKAVSASLRHHDQLGRLRPANIATIVTHLAASVLVAAGLVVSRYT